MEMPILKDYLEIGPVWKEIYESLQEYCPDENPLAFFEVVTEDALFFESNYKDYLTIREHFIKPEFTGEYRNLYFIGVQNCILELPDYWEIINGDFFQSYRIIADPAETRLGALAYHERNIENSFDFDFEELRTYLDKYPNNQDRKSTLINLKKKALEEAPLQGKLVGRKIKKFIEDCDQELDSIYNNELGVVNADNKLANKPEEEYSLFNQAEVALIHYYGSQTGEIEKIERRNSSKIATDYGFNDPNSGLSLMRMVRKANDKIWRFGFNGENKNAESSKKKRLEKTVEYFKDKNYTKAHEIASNELFIFLKQYNRKFGD